MRVLVTFEPEYDYGIVGVDQTTSRDAIDQAIRRQLRLWQRRATVADLVRRQEAERRVRQLGEARVVLLDGQRRQRYDHQLDAHRTPPAHPLLRASVPSPDPVPLPPPSDPVRVPPPSDPVRVPPPSDPLPAPAPGPAWRRRSRPYREFRDERLAPICMSAAVCGALLQLGTWVVGQGPQVQAIIAGVIATCSILALIFRQRSPWLVVNRDGMLMRLPGDRRDKLVPWVLVQAIEASEVDGAQGVEIHTIDGTRILAPAPRGGRLPVGRWRFARELAKMRRLHDSHRVLPCS